MAEQIPWGLHLPWGYTALALSAAPDFEQWAHAQPKPKKGEDVPRSVWDVLTFTGDRYRDEGWSSVPGTRLARYVFEAQPFRRATVPTSGRATVVRPTVARYAIRSAVLPRIQDALAPLPVDVTVTAGASVDTAGLRVPANATLHAWLDHDDVLATASLVVGHGGHSTTMRALSFGVPLVIMPANPLIDQKGVGQAIEAAGAGIALPKKAGAERIRAAVKRVLAEPGYHQAAAALGADIRERDGAKVAADAISAHLSPTSIRP